jgi:hypothetical protein
MKKKIMSQDVSQTVYLFLATCALLLPHIGFAATTGTTALFRQVGSGSSSAVGDYVSATVANGGMNQIYQFYLEVPPLTTQIVVRLFDADIGRGAGGGNHDWQQGGGFNTRCRYTLYNPTGGQVATFVGRENAGTNNGWDTLATVANPASGHWRLVSDMSSANSNGGDDCNGWGFDVAGTASGGASVEIKAYAFSFVPVGELSQTGATTTTTLYPYVTSGCSSNWKDFDGDSTTGNCVITYRSRNGAISGSYTGSGSTVWLNHNISGYESDFLTIDSGIWTWTGTYTQTGAGGGNFGVFYMGNYNNATTPPTAQPEGNTFRAYLPSGTGVTPGGAPAKPVFNQKISFVSGPNPPAVGSTTRVRIEIIVFNPAVQAITFSAANQVTAYVPGGGVVYAGNPIASQGTYTTPAVGGAGAVTWNPGTVAGNNTYATLYYEVNVTPPNINRLPLTGNPAANGTTARYVDETGNAATGTYTYGPLCELAVTAGGPNIPTWVAISCFEADMSSGQPGVEWRTSAENGTVGFYLWRQDGESKEYELVNPNFLPALTNAMAGGIYKLVDPDVQYGEKVVYRLEEINARGESQSYGPFIVTFDSAPDNVRDKGKFYKKDSKEIQTRVSGYRTAALTTSEYEKGRVQARSNAMRIQAVKTASQGGTRVRIAVKDRGLFHVPAASIASALGQTTAQVEGLIASHFLSLSNRGEPVAWIAAADRGGIYFYGEKLENPFSDQNIYWLEPGPGMTFAAVSGGNAAPAPVDQTFNATRHYEQNLVPLMSLYSNAEDDFWLWKPVEAGGVVEIFPMPVSAPAAAGAATLTVNLKGASDTLAAIDHHVRLYLNDKQIGESWWDGMDAHTCQFSFNQSILYEGKNTFVVSGILDGGVKYGYFYLDSFDLNYQQYYRVANNALWCQGDANQAVSVTGFTDAQVLVLDVSQPRQPKLVSTTGIDQSGRVTFVPDGADTPYLVIGLSAVSQPFSITAAASIDLKQNIQNAEYLLIAPAEFAGEARQLADYRRSQGLDALVVTLDDIYDSFNWGLASPLAIKDFLKFNYALLSSKRLKYAVLVGRGTFDFKNYIGCGDNLVPPLLAATSDGLFAADNLLGDLENDDGIPEIAIGRLPVISIEELRTVVNKIKTHGSSGGSWTDKALLINDNADDGGDFPSTSENLGRQLIGYGLERLSLRGFVNYGETRLGIIDAINAGVALVNYVGHAGVDQLAEENIFNIDDLPFLENGDRLPVMVFVTCAAGRFDIPAFTCLGEALVLKDYGGIAAALAPSSAAINSQSGLLVEEFYKAAFSAQEKDLGMAWLRAAKNFVQQGGKPQVLNIFNIIGDPAVMFK